jgi:hypothetical protein
MNLSTTLKYFFYLRRNRFRQAILCILYINFVFSVNMFSQPFIDVPINIQGIFEGSLDVGDYDNDGDIDILITGAKSNIYNSIYDSDEIRDFHGSLYKNNG